MALYIEAAIDTLQAYLQSNSAAKVAEINSEYGAPDIEDYTEWLIGEVPEELPTAPALLLRPVGVDMSIGDLPGGYAAVGSKVQAVVFDADPDPETRWRKLSRHAQLVYELIRAWELSGGYVVQWDGEWSFSTAMDEDPFLQGVMLPLKLTKHEQIS